jgi:hypothetical protein
MSLKVRASGVSHLSMIFKQTTHFAVLLSLPVLGPPSSDASQRMQRWRWRDFWDKTKR